MTRREGFSLVELLIALVILGIALVAFAFSQVGALRASTRSALVTEAKAAANRVLEEKTGEVLRVVEVANTSSYADQYDADVDKSYSFYFHDYYFRCPVAVAATTGRTTLRSEADLGGCSGTVDPQLGGGAALDGIENVRVEWALSGRNGVLGEGIVNIIVTAEATTGAIVTVGTTITCYDIYPAPTKNAPEPCPEPPESNAAGGGRP